MQQRVTSPPDIAHASTDATDDSRVSNDTRSVIEKTSISSGNDSVHNANPVTRTGTTSIDSDAPHTKHRLMARPSI